MDKLPTVLCNAQVEIADLDLDYFVMDHFQSLVRFSPNRYQRIRLCDCVETNRLAYLICWAPNQESGIHDHPEGGCLVKVLSGTLEEITLSKDRCQQGKMLHPNEYSYQCGQTGLHNIVNHGPQPAVTLHIYAPTEYTPKFYKSWSSL